MGIFVSSLAHLFDNNRAWAQRQVAQQPDFFTALEEQQHPEYLWIGCADSRVPANEIIGLPPGGVFVHRNIANVVVHTDLNCLSVIQYAVEVLKVGHIIVCGHYGCGGVRAALETTDHGLVDNWLRHIEDIAARYSGVLEAAADERARVDKLCELNVIEQVRNVCRTTIVQDAWRRGQAVAVHGWVYSLHDGLIRDLGVSADAPASR